MSKKLETAPGTWGLLANGASGHWSISVDQSIDRDAWSLEMDGPQVYLVFQLDGLEIPQKALRFLDSSATAARPRKNGKRRPEADTLVLGRFGSATVSLVRDNEDFTRCFLLVGPRGQSTLRVNLDAADIQGLIEALGQVVGDIEPAPGEQ